MDASTDENYFSADDGADTRNSSAKSLNTLLGREGGGVMNHHPNRSEHEQTDYARQDPQLRVPGRHFGTIPKVDGPDRRWLKRGVVVRVEGGRSPGARLL